MNRTIHKIEKIGQNFTKILLTLKYPPGIPKNSSKYFRNPKNLVKNHKNRSTSPENAKRIPQKFQSIKIDFNTLLNETNETDFVLLLFAQDIFLTLLRSFHAAHSMILQEGGMLTTLTAAVIAQMDQSSSQNQLYTGGYSNNSKFVVCVCNVGDSLAYVYSPKYGVREITHGNFIVIIFFNF